ncbi:MAG TPA: MFS transporter [Bacteroidota bacterium]|nr:MFS transporter [Bacteroidota bacterium]
MSSGQATVLQPDGRGELPGVYRWVVLFFISLPMFGNYYIYDAINPLGDIFASQLGFTDENIGWLNSSYSVAAVLTLLIGGWMVDRFGLRLSIAVFSVLCLLGAMLTAFSGDFLVMASGRAVLGLGAESLIVAVTAGLAKWFKGKLLSFAFGLNLLVARSASVMADNSPSWAPGVFYPDGPAAPASWQGPLMLGVIAGVVCVVGAAAYWWLERNAEKNYLLGTAGEIDRLSTKDVFTFPKSFWLIVGLCFAFYSAIFPFRTFAIKFFMHTHFGGLAEDVARGEAGAFNSLLPMAAMFVTPLFGLLVDLVGKRALFMMVGSLLLMPVYLIMMYSGATLWVPVIMMGIAFSLVPAILWPSVAYIVDQKRLGSAYALMTLIQQVGFFLFNWLVGVANDASGAGAANPGGYATGMWLFSILGFVGMFFAIMLKRSESGPGGHGLETIRAGKKAQA